MDKTRSVVDSVPCKLNQFQEILVNVPTRKDIVFAFILYAGSFVVVDASGKEKVLESGSKVGCIVSQVLFYEQVRVLKKSSEWCVFSSHLKMMCHYLTICRRSLKHRLHKHVMFLCVLITRL